MRALALLLLPTAAGAQALADTHFPPGFCFARAYGESHLAAHPAQRVTAISLTPSADPDPTAMTVTVSLRGEDEALAGAAYCEPAGEHLLCGLEGDAGGFELEPQGDGVILVVGERGMAFEGGAGVHVLRADAGDDRAFLLPRC